MFTTVLLVKKIKMLTLSHGPKTPLVACVFYLVLILYLFLAKGEEVYLYLSGSLIFFVSFVTLVYFILFLFLLLVFLFLFSLFQFTMYSSSVSRENIMERLPR